MTKLDIRDLINTRKYISFIEMKKKTKKIHRILTGYFKNFCLTEIIEKNQLEPFIR